MTSQKELIPLTPGDILRHAREESGLSLERAAQRSGIRLSTLAAIESGDTGEIPSVYLRGYIRNYARFLGIDPTEVDDRMEHVRGAEPEIRSVFSAGARQGGGEKWLKVSSYLAASALIATLAWQFTHEAVRLSQGESALVDSASGTIGTHAAETGEPGESAPAPAGRHLTASIAAVEVLKQRSTVPVSAAAEQAWAALGGDSEAPAVAGQHRLALMTSADTWVEISGADGRELEMDLIRAGTRREYSDAGPFRVMIGRASAVEMALDGQAVDLGPHTRGNVAHLTLGSAAGPADTRTTAGRTD